MDDKKIIGHIKKQEVMEQEEQPEEGQAAKSGEPDDTTTTEEEGLVVGPRRWKTQLITALKKAVAAGKIKEQKRCWKEATKWR